MNRIAVFITLLLTSGPAIGLAQLPFESKRDPYRNLFGPPARTQIVRPTQLPRPRNTTPLTPQVVCGTLIVPADPRIDPKIVAKLPPNAPSFTMQSVTPRVCKPE